MFGRIGIGACHQDAPVAVAAARAPNLLPIHDVTVAVALGFGTERTQVTTCARFAEQLTPHMFGAQRGVQMFGLLFRCPEFLYCTACEYETNHVENAGHSNEGAFVKPLSLMSGS